MNVAAILVEIITIFTPIQTLDYHLDSVDHPASTANVILVCNSLYLTSLVSSIVVLCVQFTCMLGCSSKACVLLSIDYQCHSVRNTLKLLIRVFIINWHEMHATLYCLCLCITVVRELEGSFNRSKSERKPSKSKKDKKGKIGEATPQ